MVEKTSIDIDNISQKGLLVGGEDERMEILLFTESQKSDFYSGNLNLDSLTGSFSCQTFLPKYPEMFT